MRLTKHPTLHESIKAKIKNNWSDERLRQEYSWISEQNFQAVLRDAKAAIKVEILTERGDA